MNCLKRTLNNFPMFVYTTNFFYLNLNFNSYFNFLLFEIILTFN